MKKILFLLFAVFLGARECTSYETCLNLYKKAGGGELAVKHFYVNLCSQKNPQACKEAAKYTGFYSHTSNRFLESAKLYELGCNYGDGESCYKAGEFAVCDNIHAAYERFSKSCELNYRRCDSDICEDPCVRALNIKQNNILSGKKRPYDVFNMYKPTKIAPDDSTFAIDACEYNLHFKHKNTTNCTYAGYMLLLERNYEESRKYSKIACDMGDLVACVNIIALNNAEFKEDKAFTKDFLKKVNFACKDKDFYNCGALGMAYYNGFGMKKNIKKAKDILTNSCLYANPFACISIGDFYRYQEVEPKKALEYYYKACDLGLNRACVIYDEVVKELK